MRSGPILAVKFRRRRLGLTNYKKRLALVKSKKSRLIVRISNQYIKLQVVNFEEKGDKVLLSVNSKELRTHGWKGGLKNIPAAYLTGYLLGSKAKKLKVKELILDSGLVNPNARIMAAVKGVSDSGLSIPFSEDVAPVEERLSGVHISEDVKKNFEEVKKKL